MIYHYFRWCGPCKAIAPYVHDKSKETGIALIKIDVDVAQDASNHLKVQAMPTFFAVDKEFNILHTVVGGGKANVDAVFNAAHK